MGDLSEIKDEIKGINKKLDTLIENKGTMVERTKNHTWHIRSIWLFLASLAAFVFKTGITK